MRAVLAGERVPLDDASKVILFMLWKPEGCDVTITADRFEVRHGWNRAENRYLLDGAAPVLSGLLELGAVVGPFQQGRFTTAPGSFFDRSVGRRTVWIDSSAETVRVFVRDEMPDDASPDLPAPLEFHARFFTFPEATACPHCGELAESYRHLLAGPLVCAACGRSFPLPDVA